MITLEQVEKLRERASVTYEDAKAALEITGGDLLEAMIYLERQGKIPGPETSFYNTRTGGGQGGPGYPGGPGPWPESGPGTGAWPGGPGAHYYQEAQQQQYRPKGPGFGQQLGILWHKFCNLVKKANSNQFAVLREGRCVISMPVTLLIISLICFFWVTIPVLIIALFFGFRYKFQGPDFGREAINNVMDKAADTAENLKRSVMTEDQSEDGTGGAGQ